MDLLLKVGILVVVIAVIAGISVTLFTPPQGQGSLTAEQLVLNDVNKTYPGAIVSVINSTLSSENESGMLFLSVVINPTSPCPTLQIEHYNYQATHLVSTIDNIYINYVSGNCAVPVLSSPGFTVGSSYVATAVAYNRSAWVQHYVTVFGYNLTDAHSKYYPSMAANLTPLNTSFLNVWLVNFTASPASYSEYTVLNQTGKIIGNYTLSR
jgi:hypothetical protein